MANVSFAGIDLSDLGVSVTELDGRAMAAWNPTKQAILGRDAMADTGGQFSLDTQTRVGGMLSSDPDAQDHDVLLERLDEVKALLDPIEGFQRLVVTGDRPDYYRWCRYQSMDFNERKPIFKLPFQPINIVFDNHEPYWRKDIADVNVSAVGSPLANAGSRKTRPIIEATISGTIAATVTSKVQPATLFELDGQYAARWLGVSGDGELTNGEKLIIDADALTVMKEAPAGNPPVDVIRYYDYAGEHSYVYGGFPMIIKGGSVLSAKHPNISSLVFRYDELYI